MSHVYFSDLPKELFTLPNGRSYVFTSFLSFFFFYFDKFDVKNYFIRLHILLITVPFIGSINSRGIKDYQ